MLVIVPCGGKGTRLGYRGQKCLIPTAGRPFLHWRLDQLVESGATEFILLGGTTADVWDSVGDSWQGRELQHVADPVQGIQGPWDSISRLCKNWLVRSPFWVAFGDVWHPAPLQPDLTAPTMYVTAESPTEPFNYLGAYLDVGCYLTTREGPHPALWTGHEVPGRTYTINTPEQWEETSAYLGRHGRTS